MSKTDWLPRGRHHHYNRTRLSSCLVLPDIPLGTVMLGKCIAELQFLTRFTHQATGYAAQHSWWPSQAGINSESCGKRTFGVKMVGMMEMGVPIDRTVWRPSKLSVHLPLLDSIYHTHLCTCISLSNSSTRRYKNTIEHSDSERCSYTNNVI